MNRLAVACAIFLTGTAPVFGEGDHTSLEIQLFVQSELEKRFVNDMLSFIDFDQQRLVQTVPIEAHPLIFKGEGLFVACLTVASANGEEFPVDIFVLDTASGLQTTQVTFGHGPRDQLRLMIQSGFFTKYN